MRHLSLVTLALVLDVLALSQDDRAVTVDVGAVLGVNPGEVLLLELLGERIPGNLLQVLVVAEADAEQSLVALPLRLRGVRGVPTAFFDDRAD